MKATILATLLGFMMALAGSADAADKDSKDKKKAEAPAAAAPAAAAGAESTISGEMMCGKCALKQTAKCQNVLKASDGTVYHLEHNQVAKDNHGKVCSGTAKATVKGTVAEKDGKKILTASDIKYE